MALKNWITGLIRLLPNFFRYRVYPLSSIHTQKNLRLSFFFRFDLVIDDSISPPHYKLCQVGIAFGQNITDIYDGWKRWDENIAKKGNAMSSSFQHSFSQGCVPSQKLFIYTVHKSAARKLNKITWLPHYSNFVPNNLYLCWAKQEKKSRPFIFQWKLLTKIVFLGWKKYSIYQS